MAKEWILGGLGQKAPLPKGPAVACEPPRLSEIRTLLVGLRPPVATGLRGLGMNQSQKGVAPGTKRLFIAHPNLRLHPL